MKEYLNDYKNLISLLLETFLRNDNIGAEIGVDKGETSQFILSNCSIKQTYGVDPYSRAPDTFYEAKSILDVYGNYTLLKMTSSEAVDQIPNGLDFVFLDGSHYHADVMRDLENYFPKLRSGGLLIGHDWTSKVSFGGVVKAAGRFLYENRELLEPLYSNEQLQQMGLPFKRAGHCPHPPHVLVHKSSSEFPLWWRIKK